MLDTCTGTGGFLISAMKKMIIDAGGDLEKEKLIKSKQIVGVEQQHHIFSLACSNMYIHCDGQINLIKGNCFDPNIIKIIKSYKPNVAFLNPPYTITKNDIEEMEFIINSLSLIEKGSLCIAIVPMSCVTESKKVKIDLRERLLKNHTLEAVFSMPNELFHNSNVTVNTCIMVLKAKEKHPINYKTYFGYWKEDGFIKIKNIGRIDFYHKWNSIQNKWLESFRNKEEIPGHSIKKVVKSSDEWCAEAYMETDYNLLERSSFIKNIKAYLSYKLNKDNGNISIINKSILDKKINLNTTDWKYFRYDNGTNNSIFKIKKGKRLTKKDQINGKIPYVSSSSLNNGIDNYLSNGYTDKNCISFACYGSIGEVFYQDEKVWISDNANAFYVRKKMLNPFLAIFLVTVLRLEKFRFSYGMTGKKERLQGFSIKLPIDINGDPDWNYMENYIKSLPYSSSLYNTGGYSNLFICKHTTA